MESVFFITGSSRGIGKALAEALLAENEKNWVVGLSRTNELEHERFVFIEADISQVSAAFCRQLFAKYQPTDKVVLVNNAGTLGDTAPVGKIDSDKLGRVFMTNITAPAVLMNEFVHTYEGGTALPLILNISSGAGKYPVDGWFSYCSSKAALDMLSEVAALEAEKKGSKLKVFSVAPGVVDTAMQAEIRTKSEEKFSRVKDFVRMKEEGSLARPEEVARKLMELVQSPEKFGGVIQDVRKI